MKRLQDCLGRLSGKLLNKHEAARITADAQEYLAEGRPVHDAERMAVEDARRDTEENAQAVLQQIARLKPDALDHAKAILTGSAAKVQLGEHHKGLLAELQKSGATNEHVRELIGKDNPWTHSLPEETSAQDLPTGQGEEVKGELPEQKQEPPKAAPQQAREEPTPKRQPKPPAEKPRAQAGGEVPGVEPTAENLTPQSALKTAQAIADRVGIKIKQVDSGNKSGIEFKDGEIHIQPNRVHQSMETIRANQAKKGIKSTPEEWLEEAIREELIHKAQADVAQAAGKPIDDFYNSIPDDALPDGWDDAVRGARTDYAEMKPWQKRAEFVRMVLQGKWRGTITEALHRILNDVLKYLKLTAEKGTPWLKEHVAEVEKRVEGLKPEEKAAPTESETARLERHIATLDSRIKADKRRSIVNPEDTARMENLRADLKKAKTTEPPKINEGAVRAKIQERLDEYRYAYEQDPSQLRKLIDNTLQDQLAESEEFQKWVSGNIHRATVEMDKITSDAVERIASGVEAEWKAKDAAEAEAAKSSRDEFEKMRQREKDEAEESAKRSKASRDAATVDKLIREQFGSNFKNADDHLARLRKDMKAARDVRVASPISGKPYWPDANRGIAAELQKRIDALPQKLADVAQKLKWQSITPPDSLSFEADRKKELPPLFEPERTRAPEIERYRKALAKVEEKLVDEDHPNWSRLNDTKNKLTAKLRALESAAVPAAKFETAEERVAKPVEAPAPEKKAAEKLAKAADTNPAKLKVQKEYLLAALDKAHGEAKDGTPAVEADAELTALDGRWEAGDTAETRKAKYEKDVVPLYAKYDIPASTEAHEGYKALNGEMVQVEPSRVLEQSAREKLLRAAIEKARMEQLPKIEIEVPGDGTFKIINTKDAIARFRDIAKKQFPSKTPAPDRGPSNMRTTPTAIPPIGKPKAAGDFLKAAAANVSTDDTRFVINLIYSDGKNVVATNGKRMLVIDAKAGGTKENPVLFQPKSLTAVEKDKDGTPLKFPDWKQIVPTDLKHEIKNIKTGDLMKLLIQAQEVTTEKNNAVKIHADDKGRISVSSNGPDIGSFEGGAADMNTAKVVTALNPEYVVDGLRAARALGHETVSLKYTDDMSPIQITAPGMKFIQMPMRLSADAPDEAYQVPHRPRPDGPPAHNLLEGGLMPDDVYTHPHFYVGDPSASSTRETIAALRAVRGKPNAEITIYRASPKKALNHGDWVSLSKSYAAQHGMADSPSNDVPVHSFTVKARDLVWSMDDLNEFGYYPKGGGTLSADAPSAFERMKPELRPEPEPLPNKLKTTDHDHSRTGERTERQPAEEADGRGIGRAGQEEGANRPGPSRTHAPRPAETHARGHQEDEGGARRKEGLSADAPTRQTDTPEFKRWFGQSKVVDEKGDPMVVYHNSPTTGISTFLPFARDTLNGDKTKADVEAIMARLRASAKIGTMDFRAGTFFTPSKSDYVGYGEHQYATYVKAENPIYFDGTTGKGTILDASKRADALIIRHDGKINEIAVLLPEQIKSATHNDGSFDASDPSILSADAPDSTTSIKNAQTDIDRDATLLRPAGEPNRRPWKMVEEEAREAIAGDNRATDRLLSSLKERPRAVSDTESAMLAIRWSEQKKALAKLDGEIISAAEKDDHDGIRALTKERNEAENAMQDLADVLRMVGTKAGQALAARKMFDPSAWTMEAMEQRLRAKLDGRKLTDDEREEVRKSFEKITESQRAIDEGAKKAKAEVVAKAVDEQMAEWKIEFEQAKKAPVMSLSLKAVAEAKKRKAAALERLKAMESLSAAPPESDNAKKADPRMEIYADVAAGHLAEGATVYDDWKAKMIGDLGDGVKPHLGKLWFEARKRLSTIETEVSGTGSSAIAAKLKTRIEDGDELADLIPYVQRMAKSFVAEGIDERNKLVAAVHEKLTEFIPEITREKVSELISGYGDFRALSKDEVDVKFRDLKGQLRQVSKIDVMTKRLREKEKSPGLKPSGMEHPAPSDEERALTKEVNELKKQFPESDSGENHLQSAVEAIEKRLTNQIKDLTTEIEAGGTMRKARSLPQTNAHIDALRAERDRLKKILDDMKGKPEMTDEQRIKIAMRVTKASYDEYARKIKENDFLPKEKQLPPTSPELEHLRAEQRAIVAEFNELKVLNEGYIAKQQASKEAKLVKSIADLDAKLQSGDIAPEAKVTPADSAKVEALKAERAAMQKLLNDLRHPGKTPTEIEQGKINKAKEALAELDRKLQAGEIAPESKSAQPMSAEREAINAEKAAMVKLLNELRNPKKTPTEIEQRKIEQTQKSIDALDAKLRAGDLSTNAKSTGPMSSAREALVAERAAMQKQLAELRRIEKRGGATEEERRIAAWKKSIERRTADLLKRVKEGNLTKSKPIEIARTPEMLKLQAENDLAKRAFNEAVIEKQMRERPLYKKIWGAVPETLNAARAIMTSFDLSAVLRQGGFVALAHPVRAAKIFPDMLRAFSSAEKQAAIEAEIKARPNADLYRTAKLALTRDDGSLSQMEEAYMSRWLKKIPGFAGGGFIRGSERAYTTFLNRLRADSFDAMAATLTKSGTPTGEEAAAIANFVNIATGRGAVSQAWAAGASRLNTVFFSPRYVLSRFQLLLGQPLTKGTLRTKGAVAKEYARFLIGAGVVYGLASMFSDRDMEKDPRSSLFGKVRFGNTSLDPMTGLLQNTVFLSRLGSGETKTGKGEVKSLVSGKFGQDDRGDVLVRFLRTKLAPVPGAAWDLAVRKNVVGEPVTPASAATRLVEPLAFSDIYEAMRDNGVVEGTALGLLALLGMGVQTYDPEAKKAAKEAAKPSASAKPDKSRFLSVF